MEVIYELMRLRQEFIQEYMDMYERPPSDLIDAVLWVAKEPPSVKVQNTPRTIALTAFKQPNTNRTIIHLVNSVRDEINLPILELNQCSRIKIFVNTVKEPSRVFEVGKSGLSWSIKGDEVIIDTPKFYDHKIIIVEY